MKNIKIEDNKISYMDSSKIYKNFLNTPIKTLTIPGKVTSDNIIDIYDLFCVFSFSVKETVRSAV